MKKKSLFPQTKVKNPEPAIKDDGWVVWAAWADRITFEEIKIVVKNTIALGLKPATKKPSL